MNLQHENDFTNNLSYWQIKNIKQIFEKLEKLIHQIYN